MIVFYYLSIVILFACNNSYILDVIWLPVPMSISDEQKFALTNFNDITYSKLAVMIGEGKIDEQFRRAYLLYVSSCFLCPTSQMTPSRKLLRAIVDVHNLHKYNWRKFSFD